VSTYWSVCLRVCLSFSLSCVSIFVYAFPPLFPLLVCTCILLHPHISTTDPLDTM